MQAVVERLAERVMSSGKLPSEIVDEGVVRGLSPEELRYFARVGLLYMISNFLHNMRKVILLEQSSSTCADTHVIVAKTTTDCDVDVKVTYARVVLDHVYYEGAGGEMKPLRDFMVDDCEWAARKAQAQAQAWEDLRAWFACAARMLEQHHAKTLGRLPLKLQEEIARSFPKVA